jgi:hypothetical protein
MFYNSRLACDLQVSCLEDFFGEDTIFLACPHDRLGTNDFSLDVDGKI